MSVCVLHGLTGEVLVTLPIEQITTVRHAQKLLKSALGIPLKEQRILCNGELLKPTQQIHCSSQFSLIRIAPRCCQCGLSDAALRSCSGCFDTHYCGTACQRVHWKQHQLECVLYRPKPT